jgi:hypothetical protein
VPERSNRRHKESITEQTRSSCAGPEGDYECVRLRGAIAMRMMARRPSRSQGAPRWQPDRCIATFVRPCSRHLNTEFADILHKMASFGPPSELMLRGNKGDEHD